MKHAVIFCHPNEGSFTASVAQAYRDAVRRLGHSVILRDLYRMNFDPCLKAGELPGANATVSADVAAERSLIGDADVFVFVYPLWLNAPPALVKGYMERVFGYGFAYGAGGHSSTPLLKGRKLLSFSSSGAPVEWVRQTGAFGAIHQLYDRYFAELCGFVPLEHVHFGNIVPGATPAYIQGRLAEIVRTVDQYFAAVA